jgi:CRP-like cAMP-binding protein
LPPERKAELEIERFRGIAGLVRETLEAALEFLDHRTGCDVAEEVAADDAIFGQAREPGFVGVVLFDRPVFVDGDEAERQRVDIGFRKIENPLRRHFHRRGAFARKCRAPLEPKVPAVAGLTDDQIARLAADGAIERFSRGEIVALDAPLVTIVTGAWFRVFRHAAFVRDVTLFLAMTGDVLAPGAVFGERSAESGAEAIADAAVLRLSREAFERHAEADPSLYVRVAANVGRRVSRLQTKLEAFSRSGVEARVAGALLEIADDFGVGVSGGIKIDLPLSQEDLAHLAGTSRESCSQAVAAFARAGYVVGGRLKGLVIADRPALEGLFP